MQLRDPQQFQLPLLSPVLAAIKAELKAGRGFYLIKRLPVQQWSREQVGLFVWPNLSYVCCMPNATCLPCIAKLLSTHERSAGKQSSPWYQLLMHLASPCSTTYCCGFLQLQVMCAYWGLGLHLGVAIPQNQKGHLVGHVKVRVANKANSSSARIDLRVGMYSPAHSRDRLYAALCFGPAEQ
jgi:hypothetical protein